MGAPCKLPWAPVHQLGTLGTQAPWRLHSPLSPALWFPQKYTEEVLSAADPRQPPPPPPHFRSSPERVHRSGPPKVGSTVQGCGVALVPSHPQALP